LKLFLKLFQKNWIEVYCSLIFGIDNNGKVHRISANEFIGKCGLPEK
jgi:hypothetical protein